VRPATYAERSSVAGKVKFAKISCRTLAPARHPGRPLSSPQAVPTRKSEGVPLLRCGLPKRDADVDIFVFNFDLAIAVPEARIYFDLTCRIPLTVIYA
jgi:hypothetical protein